MVNMTPPGFEVFGTQRMSGVALPETNTAGLDIADAQALRDVLDRISPDIVIHLAAISAERECRADVSRARQVHVDSTQTIANWSKRTGGRVVFTSTDLVFDGKKGWYTERDERHSEMVYGDLKIEAEDALMELHGALIVRLPLMYGLSIDESRGMLESFITRGNQGEPQDLFTDEYRTPLFVEDAAAMIWQLAGGDTDGVLHLGGPARFSRLMIGAAFSTMLDLDKCVVRAVTRRDKHMDYRPADTSLDSSRAKAMGFKPRPLEEALVKIRSDLERRSRQQQAPSQ